MTLASAFILIENGVGRIGGTLFIIAYIFYLRHSIDEYLIALIVMSVGTSMPELSVSVSAARKGFATMALGNIIGRNVANILCVLGFAAIIRPISIAPEQIY